MKHVYVVTHEARNSNWIEVYATLKSARAKVISLINEHEGYGVEFDLIDVKNGVFQSENDEIWIYISKEKLL